MIEALNMQLDIVRTVIQNPVNEISVCVDRKRETGVFYTLIAVYSIEVRKQLAHQLVTADLFASNNDYVGSFTLKDTMYLLFRYHKENLLCDREAIFAPTFAARKQLATWFLVACIESGFTQMFGALLLQDRNVNFSQDGKVYFNYFIDFENVALDQTTYYQKVSEYIFQMLSREYAVKFDNDVSQYPSELQVLYKKIQNNSLQSYNQILTFVKMLPDNPSAQNRGWRKLLASVSAFFAYLKKNATRLFLLIIVLVTLAYLSYQVYMRVSIDQQAKRNIEYGGMSQIGDVYLGEEEL